jgi:hypothetical protein
MSANRPPICAPPIPPVELPANADDAASINEVANHSFTFLVAENRVLKILIVLLSLIKG